MSTKAFSYKHPLRTEALQSLNLFTVLNKEAFINFEPSSFPTRQTHFEKIEKFNDFADCFLLFLDPSECLNYYNIIRNLWKRVNWHNKSYTKTQKVIQIKQDITCQLSKPYYLGN